ncbi:MAG: NACHT and WD repeat domain-containing protein [Saprospiraceae bacterium]
MMHRYPGPRSFTGDDRHLFFGRDAEKQELFRLIVLNDLVVLFGESGSGKTSLLQAGVCPELEERQYKPVFIRLNNTDETPELQVCHQLKEGGYIPADMPEDRSLWEYFSRFWHVDLGEVYTPVVVFDQFEELFTLYPPEQRAVFIEQFAAIANRRPPAGLSLEAAAPPQAKFVFSLRSDFLYLLDELSADIPAILRCRFSLRLLDRDRAEDAITRPAAMPGGYASPIFGYSAAALEGILGALAANVGAGQNVGGVLNPSDVKTDVKTTEIAAFQLQLVCRQLEDKIIRQRRPAGFQVAPDFYGGTEGIRQIIEDFYHSVLEKIPDAEREAVEKLLARGLIRNGRRIMMEASAMRDEYGVSQAALELLHDERLLKREARKGELYYEISHDTLVKPVLERFKKIEEAERAAEAERLRLQAAEDKRRLDEAERLTREAVQGRKRARVFSILAGAVAVVAIGLGVFAFFKQQESGKTALTAYANDLAYKSTIALQDGDRNTAFRLAEFAHHYVEANNPSAAQAMIDALYYNDHPDTTHRLPRPATLGGHNPEVISVAFSPDGKTLATGCWDNTTKIWGLESSNALMILEGHGAKVISVAFSPNGKILATGSEDRTAKIWDLESGKALMTLEGYISSVSSIAFSPNGKTLATGSEKTVKIWDLETGKALMTLEGHSASVSSVAFSPNGKTLATGAGNIYGDDNTAKIWDLKSGKVLMTLKGHRYYVSSVAFSPDGKTLATGSWDNTAKIWDLHSSKALMTLKGHTYYVYSVAFSPDGKTLATGSLDKTARIWDLERGKTLMTLEGHSSSVYSVAFSLNGKILATGAGDGSGNGSIAKIWDLDSGKALMTFKDHTFLVTSVAFSPDGKRLASGSYDKTAKIWDLESGKALMTLEGHTSEVIDIAFSPNGKTLATGSYDGRAKIWDLETGKALMTLGGYGSNVVSVAFSPNGKTLATGSLDKTAKIWGLESGKILRTLEDHLHGVWGIVFSPDGKTLATGSFDGSAKIWDLETGKALMTFEGHRETVYSVAFSPDGKKFATGAKDGTAKIWDLESGKALMTLEGHTSSVLRVAFSPDGKILATGSSDNTAKIWDLETGKALMTLEGHRKTVYSVAFSPDGKTLATGAGDILGNDNTVKIWEITGDGLIRRWQETGPQADLTLSQLQHYNLENLLDQHPDNEQKLLATREVWQIKAFADLAAAQAGGSNILTRVTPLYARAERLYAAALALQDERLIRQDYAKMLRRWAEVYRSEGMADKVRELEEKADGLWKEK